MRQTALYDQFADWYEEYVGVVSGYNSVVHAMLADLLGKGDGTCLDLCCGTGARADVLRGLGWRLAGVDLSVGQLGYARARLPVVLGSAGRLPIATGSVQAVACVLAHTDMPDYAAAVREAARVLKPGGCFVHVGVHPCFVGPFADRGDPARIVINERYADRSRSFDSCSPHGVRARVGAWHVPLAGLVNAAMEAGLRLVRVAEDGQYGVPEVFGFRALA